MSNNDLEGQPLSKILRIRPSHLAQSLLQLKGRRLDLTEYKPFELIYDISPDMLTACCGRQIGKSVSLAASITANSIIRPYFSTLFVSPLSQQTSRFSTQYLEPFLASPIVRKHFIDASSKRNVFSRTLNNGSAITLGYAETEGDADRIRGVAADMFLYDEVQDASLEAIPVLSETLSASDHGFRRFTGTAKGESNTLTVLFNSSNMMEWVAKCPKCNRYTIPNDFDSCYKILTMNPEGPACVHCGGVLDMRTGQWLAAKPDIKHHIGVHIPQFCIPARASAKKWPSLVQKAHGYDKNKLANEVFGIPVGAGGRPLSMQEVKACCNPSVLSFDKGFPEDSRGILYTVLGVDWSCTGSSKSYTVVTVQGFNSLGKAFLLYAERMDGIDILEQVRKVENIYYQFKCSMIGSDRGVGVLQGQIMKRDLGLDRVNMINYVAAKSALRYDRDEDFFAADRTRAIDTVVVKIKLGMGKIEMPCWGIMEFFLKDALALFEEETISGRRVYRKDEDKTDDFVHSIVFGTIANMILRGEFTYVDKDAANSDPLSSIFS